MGTSKEFFQYGKDRLSFISSKATAIRTLYFPLTGPSHQSLKSSITPFLSGDIKKDKNHYLTKPVSREDLRYPVRNFFISVKGEGWFSLAKNDGEDNAHVEMAPLWHKLHRRCPSVGLECTILNFIPVTGEDLELMRVTVKNVTSKTISFTPTGVVPLFGRGLSNKHDHEHVTALLHRVEQLPQGVILSPTMLFNEEGHRPSDSIYYVFGFSSEGKNPCGTFPTTDNFYGLGGNVCCPEAVIKNLSPKQLSSEELQGREAVGALRFDEVTLAPAEEKTYFILAGMAPDKQRALKNYQAFNSAKKWDEAFLKNSKYWKAKCHAITLRTGDTAFDSWMHWVTLQPVLRRIFGCSFLPDHDYGKGGKGWRDIWQDLLSLLLIEPQDIRKTLIGNFAGVRIDGSNATIIGNQPGEFVADRNAITRVWMDHGLWPLTTVSHYIHQTGDFDILLEEAPYFKDRQLSRSLEKDNEWTPDDSGQLKDKKGNIHKGSLVEHILVQHLTQFFNVGEHNITRLESADWNDGMDMAFERGESVTFMSFYGGNLLLLADLLEGLTETTSTDKISLAKELITLLDSLSGETIDYDDIAAKKALLFDVYFQSVQPQISGEKIAVGIFDIINDLRRKGNWIFEHIKKNEKVSVKDQSQNCTWFNGYYDNCGQRLEGKKEDRVWMTLTGQVFPIMSGLADNDEIAKIIQSVQKYLKDPQHGGYHLNTDFGLPSYLDMGRAFGFAFGEKENGSFFSHMTVMYAYALYKRGFAREGHEVLSSIYQMATNDRYAMIYPGIPEYFDSQGRGMYHYLTGSASWVVLTMLTQVFGIQGDKGDLVISPQLVKEQFGNDSTSQISFQFADKLLSVSYINKEKLDYGQYDIEKVSVNGNPLETEKISPHAIKISRKTIQNLPPDSRIEVFLKAATKK